MAKSIPIKDVSSARHLETFTFKDATSNDRVRLEVYTGFIGVHLNANGASQVIRENIRSFLLLDKSSNTGIVREYQANDLIDVTVTAAVQSCADEDDEANVEGVDKVSVDLEPQAFAGIAGSPLCLVLRATVAALNAIVHGISFQVTVLTVLGKRVEKLTLDESERPA